MIHNELAIALVNSDLDTTDHIPKFMSKLTHVFFKHGGHIKCGITDVKKYLKDLEQGGLEISARLKISNANKRKADIMKEKLNPFLKSTGKLTVNPKSFSNNCMVYCKLGRLICSFLVYCMLSFL